MKVRFIKDILLNLISTFIPVVALQYIILPMIAQHIDADSNGLILTIISLITMVSVTFGNVLNNTRLLQDSEYKEKEIVGDFNLLLIIYSIVNIIIMSGSIYYYYGRGEVINIIFIVFISLLNLLREYLIVTFWIDIDYKKVLINNLLLVIGYFMGLVLFNVYGYWQFIYLIGLLFSLAYILYNTSLVKEGFNKTTYFKETSKKSFILLISAMLAKAMQYIDKLILFPLIGGAAVSIYYVATLSGKLISMIISPVNGVMLSYLSKMKRFNKNSFNLVLIISIMVGIVGYIICIIVSKPIFDLIYPQWANDAMLYVYITTITAIVNAICSMLSPIILKFCDTNWQIVINLSSFIFYVIFAIMLFNVYGLIGFCWGILIANIIKLLIMIGIYFFKQKEN